MTPRREPASRLSPAADRATRPPRGRAGGHGVARSLEGVNLGLVGELALTFAVVGIATGLLPGGWRRRVAAVLAAVGATLMLFATLNRPATYLAVGWWPWDVWRVVTVGPLWPTGQREQLNLLLVVPFVGFMTLAGCRAGLAAAAGVVLSLAVEYVQGATGIGTAQVADVIHNSLGSVLGAASASLLRRATHRANR